MPQEVTLNTDFCLLRHISFMFSLHANDETKKINLNRHYNFAKTIKLAVTVSIAHSLTNHNRLRSKASHLESGSDELGPWNDVNVHSGSLGIVFSLYYCM